MISEAVLDTEVRIGALTSQIPKLNSNQHTVKVQHDSGVVLQKSKTETIKDLGFTPKQIERFETLAKNLEIVEQAKEEAKANDDIVSRSLVLEKIKKSNKQKQETKIEIIKTKETFKDCNKITFDLWCNESDFRAKICGELIEYIENKCTDNFKDCIRQTIKAFFN